MRVMTKKRSTWLKNPLEPKKAIRNHTFFIGILASPIVTRRSDRISSNAYVLLNSQTQSYPE